MPTSDDPRSRRCVLSRLDRLEQAIDVEPESQEQDDLSVLTDDERESLDVLTKRCKAHAIHDNNHGLSALSLDQLYDLQDLSSIVRGHVSGEELVRLRELRALASPSLAEKAELEKLRHRISDERRRA